MSLMAITADTLSRDLGQEVPPAYVIIAKNSVLGMEDEEIRQILGCTIQDIAEVKADALYQEVRLRVAGVQAQMVSDQAASWDSIENTALKNLADRMPFEKDSEFLLKVAAVANKAQRRVSTQSRALDPTKMNGRVAISLTSRLVKKLTDNRAEVVEERVLSISDGSMSHPTFDEVDQMLSISGKTQALPNFNINSHEPTIEELAEGLKDRFG